VLVVLIEVHGRLLSGATLAQLRAVLTRPDP